MMTTAPVTAATIRQDLEAAFREADWHGAGCRCCMLEADAPGLRTMLAREAFYATDRYRPGEEYTGVTLEDVERLVADLVELSHAAVRRVIIDQTAIQLGGRLVPLAVPAETAS